MGQASLPAVDLSQVVPANAGRFQDLVYDAEKTCSLINSSNEGGKVSQKRPIVPRWHFPIARGCNRCNAGCRVVSRVGLPYDGFRRARSFA